MPLHDFQCSTCGKLQIDVYLALRSMEPPSCPSEDPTHKMEKLWSAGSASAPFKEISVDLGGGKSVTLKSMSDIRRFENASIEAWQRGVPGAQPMILRNFSQDRSNRDESVIERHFSDKIRHQRAGNPLNRPEMFSKTSGRRKIDIRSVTNPQERAEIIREHGFDRPDRED